MQVQQTKIYVIKHDIVSGAELERKKLFVQFLDGNDFLRVLDEYASKWQKVEPFGNICTERVDQGPIDVVENMGDVVSYCREISQRPLLA